MSTNDTGEKYDPAETYIMPLIMGPMSSFGPYWGSQDETYQDVETVSVFCDAVTEEAVNNLLPPVFKATGNHITIEFAYNNGVKFLAGGGYAYGLVGTMVSYTNPQSAATTEGFFPFVIFESRARPVVLGREQIGVWKMQSDVSSQKYMPNNTFRCEASMWGYPLFSIEAGPFDPKPSTQPASKTPLANLFGYKYIDSPPANVPKGPPDSSYPICTPQQYISENVTTWNGTSGSYEIGNAGVEQIGMVTNVLSALRSLFGSKPAKVLGVQRQKFGLTLRIDQSYRMDKNPPPTK